jgi:hypothetical protein
MTSLCNGSCTIADLITWVVFSVIALSAVLGFIAGGD